jgi:septum formation protein
MQHKIILASQSPRRKQLLTWADIEFEVLVQETDESYPADLAPTDVALHIAKNKCLAVQSFVPSNAVIIAADTIVVLNNEIIGKPKDSQHAIKTLSKLANQTHQVITAVHIYHNNTTIAFADVTKVIFNPLTTDQIEYYVNKYQPFDKAGAYGIQEWLGVVGIKAIEGDFYNVMGLPINRVVHALKQLNIGV